MSGSAWDDPTRNIEADIVAVVRDAAAAGDSAAAGMDAAMTRPWDESYEFNRKDFEAAVARVREQWSRPYEPEPLPPWVALSYITGEADDALQPETARRYFLNDHTPAHPRDDPAWKRVSRRTVYGGPVTEADLDVDGDQVADDFAALQGGARPPTGRAPHADAGYVLPGDAFVSWPRQAGKNRQAEETLRAWAAEFARRYGPNGMTRLYALEPDVVDVGLASARPGRRIYGDLPAAFGRADQADRVDPSAGQFVMDALLEEMRSRQSADQYLIRFPLARRYLAGDARIVADTRYGAVVELGSPTVTGDASPGTSASS